MRRASTAALSPARFREAVEEFLARISPSERAHVAMVVVFGSVARGESGPESDVDLIVVWTGRIEDAYGALMPIATDVLIDRGVDLSIHPFTAAEYGRMARLRTGFYENLDREGLLVA